MLLADREERAVAEKEIRIPFRQKFSKQVVAPSAKDVTMSAEGSGFCQT